MFLDCLLVVHRVWSRMDCSHETSAMPTVSSLPLHHLFPTLGTGSNSPAGALVHIIIRSGPRSPLVPLSMLTWVRSIPCSSHSTLRIAMQQVNMVSKHDDTTPVEHERKTPYLAGSHVRDWHHSYRYDATMGHERREIAFLALRPCLRVRTCHRSI
jgi:hypothetical protein